MNKIRTSGFLSLSIIFANIKEDWQVSALAKCGRRMVQHFHRQSAIFILTLILPHSSSIMENSSYINCWTGFQRHLFLTGTVGVWVVSEMKEGRKDIRGMLEKCLKYSWQWMNYHTSTSIMQSLKKLRGCHTYWHREVFILFLLSQQKWSKF